VNPLAELICRQAASQDLSRKDIAIGLGYKDFQKGFRRFDQCIATGYAPADFLARLTKVLKFDRGELHQAVQQSVAILEHHARQVAEEERAQEEERGRAGFTPHLWASVEKEFPRPIFLIAIAGADRYRRVDLPDGIVTMTEPQQLALIRAAATRHFADVGGNAGPFGAITAYAYRRTFDESWGVTTFGQVVNRNGGTIFVPKYTLSLKRQSGRDLVAIFRQRRRI
jgi:hypothetical protein